MSKKHDLLHASHHISVAAQKLNVAYGCKVAESHSQSELWEAEAIEAIEIAAAHLGIKLCQEQPA